MRIALKVDPDRITVDDLLAIEEGSLKTRAARDLIARFIADPETKEFMNEEDAKKVVGKLTLTELMQVGSELGNQVQAMMAGMVPTKTASE